MSFACARPAPPPERMGPPPPEPRLPAIAVEAERGPPEWARELPAASVAAPPGSSVWAAVPRRGQLTSVGVYRLEAVSASMASLVDRIGQRVEGVPAALVHPVGDTRNLHEGTIALFYTWTTPGWLGRVSRTVRGEELQVQYDWAGTTKETSVDFAEPARKGVTPLAFVEFPKAGATSMGQIVALDDARAWLLTGSGQVEVLSRKAIEALDLQAKGYGPGQKVRAYRWATGFERGTVKSAIEPGLRFEVDLAQGASSSASYFLTALVPDAERSAHP